MNSQKVECKFASETLAEASYCMSIYVNLSDSSLYMFLDLGQMVSLTCISLQPLLLHTGMGRLCTLEESVPLATMIERIKGHLKLSHLRLALGVGRTLGKYLSSSGRCTVTLDKFWFDIFLTPGLIEDRMASNSRSFCFCLRSAGITGIYCFYLCKW